MHGTPINPICRKARKESPEFALTLDASALKLLPAIGEDG